MTVDMDSVRDRLMAERLRVTSEMQALQDDLSHSLEDQTDEDEVITTGGHRAAR